MQYPWITFIIITTEVVCCIRIRPFEPRIEQTARYHKVNHENFGLRNLLTESIFLHRHKRRPQTHIHTNVDHRHTYTQTMASTTESSAVSTPKSKRKLSLSSTSGNSTSASSWGLRNLFQSTRYVSTSFQLALDIRLCVVICYNLIIYNLSNQTMLCNHKIHVLYYGSLLMLSLLVL